MRNTVRISLVLSLLLGATIANADEAIASVVSKMGAPDTVKSIRSLNDRNNTLITLWTYKGLNGASDVFVINDGESIKAIAVHGRTIVSN
ncbi:MAG: hypothetical protein H7Z18_02990 [Methylophilaceae bacterium]|nr:hypothetical protein [Methylophilaceae bacterium]